MASWTYSNPVRTCFGEDSFALLPALIGSRSYCIVTYGEPFFLSLVERLAAASVPPLHVVCDVAPNPDFALLSKQAARLADLGSYPEIFVAIGGGSVIDTAKVLAAAGGDFASVQLFLEKKSGEGRLASTPIIAVPTTAGTGSEVTCWATVWDSVAQRKYSLARPALYPEHALIDPLLMLGKPNGLTVATGLDALSHALAGC